MAYERSKKTIVFHTNQLDGRGTGHALFDYADHAERLLGHKSYVISPKDAATDDLVAAKRFNERFDVYRYDDFAKVDPFLREVNADLMYAVKSGERDHVVSTVCPTGVHAVFQNHDPHGDIYAYFSEWLFEVMTGGRAPWVPPMVHLPDDDGDLREELGIPPDAIVFGRHGGASTFDRPGAHRAVRDVARARAEIFFLFLNTDPFCAPHPNIIHLPITVDPVRKVRFVNTCDAMLHARKIGESFGVAIGEFVIRSRPVITHARGRDKAHHVMLGENAILYRNASELIEILQNFQPDPNRNWDNYSEFYSPEPIMKRFEQVYLS